MAAENLPCEHLRCIIRKKPHPGVEAKCQWLQDHLCEGRGRVPAESGTLTERGPEKTVGY
ncbi:hypothetical protein OBV_30020 [Oscillibacter valericigenes Sjm18-20]|nr:hypothetical protein OBV_30020 [Oscillibacter valericigenes Sjm18-20]